MIEYEGRCQEIILSRPFVVNSNRRKSVSFSDMRPVLLAIKPEYGDAVDDTEVWIKGANFHYSGVTVDERSATVTEVKDNLLTAVVPKRSELTNSAIVKVKVGGRIYLITLRCLICFEQK